MAERKPLTPKSIPCGYKLYDQLVKKAKKENKTVETLVSHCLWGCVND